MFGLFHPKDLTITPAPDSVLQLGINGESFFLEAGHTARLHLSGRLVKCQVDDRALLAIVIRASARSGGAAELILRVPGRIERRYHGEIEVSPAGNQLVAVVEMDREIAVASAVAAESPPGATIEALEAQAVVTRSYYAQGQGRHKKFDFCDTTHCQFLREPPLAGSLAHRAAAATRGLVLFYNGIVLPALFSACCGGRTRSLREVGLSPDGYLYYSVECAPCLRRARHWETHLGMDSTTLATKEGTESARLNIERKMGWNAIPGNNFSAQVEGNGIIIQGSGAGHGVGLCQVGAAAMAQDGSQFQQILDYYYPNTVLGIED